MHVYLDQTSVCYSEYYTQKVQLTAYTLLLKYS